MWNPLFDFRISNEVPELGLDASGWGNLSIFFHPLYVNYQNEYHSSSAGERSHRFLQVFASSRLVGLGALVSIYPETAITKAEQEAQSLELSHIVFDAEVSKELGARGITEGARFLRSEDSRSSKSQAVAVRQRLSDPVMALLLENGEFTAVEVSAELRIDLDKSEEELFARLRKKFRQQIRKYQDTLDACVRTDGAALDELRRLHFQVSGRTTRSSRTWEIQRQAVEEGSAFIVTISGLKNELLGALYVMHTPAEALSFSAAYDRQAMADGYPLGHLAEWEAIKFLRRNRLAKSYLLGSSGAATLENEKLANIVNFKDGFAPIYDLVGRLQHSRL